jgi:hypothetical protein
MKQVSGFFTKTAILFILFYAFVIPSGIAQPFNFQTWNNATTPAITVTGFQSVTIDKRGKVWAGSTLGGLYCYRDTQWVKINTYPDVTFRHGVPSNMPGDSNVWITSIGKSGVQATTGGAYLINTQTETVTQYGSGIAGGLGSRYANSLALSSQGKVYVALAQSTTAGNTNQGGVYVSNTVNPPPPSTTSFSKAIPDVGDIIYHSAGNRGDELWFGRGPNCAGGCTSPSQAPYIARLSSSGTVLSSFTANSGLPFTASGSSAFPRAIFTDETTGNTFVGLNSGGIGVYKSNNTWKMLTSANSPFPASAAVNFNAITEVYGEVWIGTTAGIFIYNGFGSLDSMSSFKMLTTADSLPSNSITDIAVDTANSFIWVTSPVGVSRAPYKPPFIRGFVFDVSVNKSTVKRDSIPDLYTTLQKRALATGVEVRMFKNGTLVDSSFTDSSGMFVLKKAIYGENYDINIGYLSATNFLQFSYENVKNHTFIGKVLMPGKLIEEVIAFKPNVTNRAFKLDLPFALSIKGGRVDGFNTADYGKAYLKFSDIFNLKDLHKERVENLASFYCAMAGVYNLGGTSTGLMNKSIESAWELVESILSIKDFIGAAKLKRPEIKFSFMINMLKIHKENHFIQQRKILDKLFTSPEAQENLKTIFTFLSDFADLSIDILENADDLSKTRKNIAKDLTKRLVAAKLADFYYYKYCNTRHKNFVSLAANSSYLAQSENTYAATFSKIYDPANPSLVKAANDNASAKDTSITNYKLVAKYADATSGALNAASILNLFPGGQVVGTVVKALAAVSKGVQIYANAQAMLTGVRGAFEIAQSSDNVLPYADLSAPPPAGISRIMYPPSQQSPNDLSTIKAQYNQKLAELKTFYNLPTYDSVMFFAKFNEFGTIDSAYSDEQRKTINKLLASTDSASIYVPGFEAKLNKIIDSFISKQYTYRQSFFYQNLAYSFDPNKVDYTPELNSLADSITVLNDSSFNGLVSLINDINLNGIAAPANLIQDSYKLNHTRNMGDQGSFTYVFTNYGSVAQQNVSFKLNQPTAGYQVTGTDSIYVGTINPNQSVTITFGFIAPFTDSCGSYIIDIKADNGKYQDVSGTLNVYDPNKYYTAKDGNWSNPETWINNAVPGSTSSVEVRHSVIVDIDVSCKTLKSFVPGGITVSAGKILTVSH